jgi:hypothetical protein
VVGDEKQTERDEQQEEKDLELPDESAEQVKGGQYKINKFAAKKK